MPTKTQYPEILEGDYRGIPMMIIRTAPEDKFPFQFGIKKARLIVKLIDEIRAFVDKHPEA